MISLINIYGYNIYKKNEDYLICLYHHFSGCRFSQLIIYVYPRVDHISCYSTIKNKHTDDFTNICDYQILPSKLVFNKDTPTFEISHTYKIDATPPEYFKKIINAHKIIKKKLSGKFTEVDHQTYDHL